jgi:hypothetical protein
LARPGEELTLGAIRQSGVRGVTICCTTCLQTAKLIPDECPDEVKLIDLQQGFVCPDCGHKGADVEPDFDWDEIDAPRP